MIKAKSCILTTLVAGLLISCLSCLTPTEAQQNTKATANRSDQNTPRPQPSSDKPAVKDVIDTSNWKTYRDAKNGYSFNYPSNLILQKKDGKVRLYHSIKYRYQDPCDMSSENPPVLSRLVDFDVTFVFVKKSFAEIAKENENLEEAPFDIPKLMGKIEGDSVRRTFEFCGHYEYFYPVRENNTLMIKDQIAGYLYEMAYSEAKNTEAWKNPNVIKPEMQASILGKIIESVEISHK